MKMQWKIDNTHLSCVGLLELIVSSIKLQNKNVVPVTIQINFYWKKKNQIPNIMKTYKQIKNLYSGLSIQVEDPRVIFHIKKFKSLVWDLNNLNSPISITNSRCVIFLKFVPFVRIMPLRLTEGNAKLRRMVGKYAITNTRNETWSHIKKN